MRRGAGGGGRGLPLRASPPFTAPLSPPSLAGADLEASLLSFEKLDRASPDLWPEQREFWGGCGGFGVCVGGALPAPLTAALCLAVPGVAEFAASFKSVSHPLRVSSAAARILAEPPLCSLGGKEGL